MSDRLPFNEMLVMGQFAQTIGFIASMQGDPRIEDACAEAERMCGELFEPMWAAEDRTAYLMTMGYLAMDIAANVTYTIDRAKLAWEGDE